MGRKVVEEVSQKQLEIFELLLNHVKRFGFQPTITELCGLLGVQPPAVRQRVQHLIAKGLLSAAPHKGERCLGFVGLKFAPYQVDEEGEPIPGQEVELGSDYVAVIKKKKGGRS